MKLEAVFTSHREFYKFAERVAGALSDRGSAIVSAPPGTGKSTLLPLALLDTPGRIIMLEPRRLAARAVAARMAHLLGEEVGDTVGVRVRFDSRVSARTRIEVVTEAVLTRKLQRDPELSGVSTLLFDEFHERNLHADLGLALALDARSVLRPDLRIGLLSASLDNARVAQLLDGAPVMSYDAQPHPVAFSYLGDVSIHGGIRKALAASHADVLVFLPGMREIRRTESALRQTPFHEADGASISVAVLHGQLPRAEQDAVLVPNAVGRRRIILATNVAETSLTIPGVDAVVDSGLAREASFDPRTGLSGLVTVRISQAAALQRAGRAGRLGPGVCMRLWTESEHHARERFSTPEIAQADLVPLALELAAWGAGDPSELRWLDEPATGPYAKACAVLRDLGAFDHTGRITTLGRRLNELPVHPRLAAMLIANREVDVETACVLAAVLEGGAPWRGPAHERPLALADAVTAVMSANQHVSKGVSVAAVRQIQRVAKSLHAGLRRETGKSEGASRRSTHADTEQVSNVGVLLLRAFPDRIARHSGSAGRFVLNSGKALRIATSDPLSRAAFLVVPVVDAGATEAIGRLAAPVTLAQLEAVLADRIVTADRVYFDRRESAVLAQRERRIGQLRLTEVALSSPSPEATVKAMLDGVRAVGLTALPWSPALRQWQARVMTVRRLFPEGTRHQLDAATDVDFWPPIDDATLTATVAEWLGPFLSGVTRVSHLARVDLRAALESLLPYAAHAVLARLTPTTMVLGSGREAPLKYEQESPPTLAMPLQEAFGMPLTPTIGDGRERVVLHLLSPARRPLQVTSDLEAFWVSAYPQVRKEMRGRYPKHVWPENPAEAPPSRTGLKHNRTRKYQ
ncbi:MAG: ATP-dependent helicase HrpB [Chromatiales bacterium]|jgi:ATP-dependent helicase HrpB|nr:ATP-dependent helicase HrpB [Chromatiales bacterium]